MCYINDNRYLQNQIRNLSNAGKSQSFILNKLKQDGFSTTIVKDLLSAFDQESESSDLTRANKWLKKHSKGQFRNKDATLFYQKDLAALARAGFSYDTAKKALTTQTESDDDFFINQ